MGHLRSWQTEKRVQTFIVDSEEVMMDLPPDLRHEVLFHMHRALISRIPFFEGKPMGFVAGVVNSITFIEATEDAAVIRQGEGLGNDGDVFFILKGIAAVWKNGVVVGDLQAGSIFGEMAVLSDEEASASVVPRTRCDLACAPGKMFLALLAKHPSTCVCLRCVLVTVPVAGTCSWWCCCCASMCWGDTCTAVC
jgi:CRP-like cAMP-binding protein